MLCRSVAHPSISALRAPSAPRALNSAQHRTAAAVHCTEVCCGLNFATPTLAPQRAHSTGCRVTCRSSAWTAAGPAATSAPLSRGLCRRLRHGLGHGLPGGQVPRDLRLPARDGAGGVNLELVPGDHVRL